MDLEKVRTTNKTHLNWIQMKSDGDGFDVFQEQTFYKVQYIRMTFMELNGYRMDLLCFKREQIVQEETDSVSSLRRKCVVPKCFSIGFDGFKCIGVDLLCFRRKQIVLAKFIESA